MQQHTRNQLHKIAAEVRELEYVPGLIMPDKEDSLRKLHKKLGRKKRSRKTVFIMLAAACVTVMFLVPAVFVNRNQFKSDQPVAKTKGKKPINKAVDIENNAPMKVNDIGITKIKHNEKHAPINKPVKKPEPVLQDLAKTSVEPLSTDSPALHPIIATAVAPVKRKYPVVHINSLKTTESTESVISDIKNPFRRIILRPDLPPSSVPVYSSDHVIHQNKNTQN